MSAALKDIDCNHTSREKNSSFALDLLLEELIKEGRHFGLFVLVALLLNFVHIDSYSECDRFPLLSVVRAFMCLTDKFLFPYWGRWFLSICGFPERSVGFTFGQMCISFSLQNLQLHQEECM